MNFNDVEKHFILTLKRCIGIRRYEPSSKQWDPISAMTWIPMVAVSFVLGSMVAVGQPARVGRPYGEGTKKFTVDAGRTVGEIRSLLGVNRGPGAFLDNYRKLGIDFIRVHDFYGPTDWYVIFPDWEAEPEDPASYDFASSDSKIQAICENGFQCFYRLGTSWRGRRKEPINDPPGTIRDEKGRVIHRADREDFKKWGVICAHIVKHYTKGWNDGFTYPILYWEIWNEPDLREQFWTGTPEQYYMLYEEAVNAIKDVDEDFHVGGPGSTGRLSEAYVEGLLQYCRKRHVPLDFFSWHSYGGRNEFNPYQFYQDAMRVRRALDEHGFTEAGNCLTEWNAGIQGRLFSHTPEAPPFYASVLGYLLNAKVDYAFQYCGVDHPGLGLHDRRTGRLKRCAYAFEAWKRLCETPEWLYARGVDKAGYILIAGRNAEKTRVQILVSDFQSGYDGFEIHITHLPWIEAQTFRLRRCVLTDNHGFEEAESAQLQGNALELKRPFRAPGLCLIELQRSSD